MRNTYNPKQVKSVLTVRAAEELARAIASEVETTDPGDVQTNLIDSLSVEYNRAPNKKKLVEDPDETQEDGQDLPPSQLDRQS